MKNILLFTTTISVLLFTLGCGLQQQQNSSSNKNIKRIGIVVGIKADKIKAYKELHADSHPGVRDLLNKYHIHNLSIFLTQINNKWYEFGHYEYTGENLEEDMNNMAKEPRYIKWLEICDPMQIPLEDESSWREMERVYFNP